MLDEAIKNLEEALYSKKDINRIDYNDLKKPLYELLKQCIQNKIYEVEVGNYQINVDPRNLSITYNTYDTFIEISNNDNYYETTQLKPFKYYVITNEEGVIEGITPAIVVVEEIINIEDEIYHNFSMELINSTELNIKDYLKDIEAIKDNIGLLSLNIDKNKEIKDVEDYLDMTKVKYATYNLENDEYTITKSTKINKTYKETIPNINKRKELLEYLYNNLINFYKQYLYNNTINN